MSKEQDEQAKKLFNATEKLLKNKDIELSTEQRSEFENIQAELAGVILSKWLPADWIRRTLMLGLFILTLYLAISVSAWFLLLLLVVGCFSPRLVGKVTIFVGKVKKCNFILFAHLHPSPTGRMGANIVSYH